MTPEKIVIHKGNVEPQYTDRMYRKDATPALTHGFVFQTAKASELPLQLGIVLFGLHFGFRVDVFPKTREASLSVYLLRWALIFSWFKQEA